MTVTFTIYVDTLEASAGRGMGKGGEGGGGSGMGKGGEGGGGSGREIGKDS